MLQSFHISAIQLRIAAVREELLSHPIYTTLGGVEEIQTFMEHHVFAVWDFMSMLKALQQQLTSTSTAWVPTDFPVARRLINEIVVAEESDIDINGNPASHYEMYVQAMKQAGADNAPVHRMLKKLRDGFKVSEVLRFNSAELQPVVLRFLKANQAIIKRGKAHEIASAFTFGREDLIPDLFGQIIKDLQRETGRFTAFVYYLDRHIELDGDEHGPMAFKMIADLCGNNEEKWLEAEATALEALQARLQFWDGIHEAILQRTQVEVH